MFCVSRVWPLCLGSIAASLITSNLKGPPPPLCAARIAPSQGIKKKQNLNDCSVRAFACLIVFLWGPWSSTKDAFGGVCWIYGRARLGTGVSAESARPPSPPIVCTCVRSKIRRFCCGLNFDLSCSAADERVRPAVVQLHIIIAIDCRRWECTWPHTLPVGTDAVPSRLPAQKEKATRAWTSLDGIAGGPDGQMALLTDWQDRQWREKDQ